MPRDALPHTMLAVRSTSPGALAVEMVPRPEPQTGEILVQVAAAALNRADVLQRAGRYPAPAGSPQDVPGLEFAGTVVARGDGAGRWKVGERVCGLVGGGAQAEYLTTHQDTVIEAPASLTLVEASAVPEAFITAHDALVTQAALRAGESVLIFAVASGVGLAAAALVGALGGTAYGTTRTSGKLERVRAAGLAEVALVAKADEIHSHVERWSGGRGIDVVLDLVGGSWAAAGVQALAHRGRLLCIGTLAGSVATVDLRRILTRRLTIRGTVLRSRSLEQKIAATTAFERDVGPLLAAGVVRPVIDGVYALGRAAEAYDRLEAGKTVGKLVLAVQPDA